METCPAAHTHQGKGCVKTVSIRCHTRGQPPGVFSQVLPYVLTSDYGLFSFRKEKTTLDSLWGDSLCHNDLEGMISTD